MSGRSAGVCIGVAAVVMLGLTGCVKHQVRTDPIEIEPIHVTVDINYRVDRRLEEFFKFQKKQQQQQQEGRKKGDAEPASGAPAGAPGPPPPEKGQPPPDSTDPPPENPVE